METIPNFPDYKITKDGKIWSERSRQWLKPGKHRGGYLLVRLCKDKDVYPKYIHRLVLETFISSCPKGMEACHNNGNSEDNRLENLRWDTRGNNRKDAIKHGTHFVPDNRGEKCGTSKLNELQVRVIHRLLEFGKLTKKEIAQIFEISCGAIRDIYVGRTWNWLFN